MSLNADILYDNEANKFKSQNGKYEAISIPFYRQGNEGITIVKEQDKIHYQINGYFENGIISNNGESLILYVTKIPRENDPEYLLDTILLSVYKKGVLLKSFKVLDFFAFISELSASSLYYWWLYETDGGKTESSIEVVGSRLKVKTDNGLSWVIDLSSGDLISRRYRALNKFVTRQVKSKKFISTIQSIDNFEIVSMSEFGVGEGVLEKIVYHGTLRLKFSNNIFTVDVYTEDVSAFKEKFSLLVKAIKQYTKQNKSKEVNFKIYCFFYDKGNMKLVSGFNPGDTPNNEEAIEIMNQTFLIRKDSGSLFLETPVLISYKFKGDAVSFEVVSR